MRPFNVIFLLVLALVLPSGLAQTQKFATHFTAQNPAVPAALLQEPKAEAWTEADRGPVEGLQVFAREKSGAVWLASKEGAARFDPRATHRWDRWHYFAGRRWLLDNEVRNIQVDETGSHKKVWIRTRSGVSLIEWRPMDLAQKAQFFEERIEQRHVRHGMVADSSLRIAGDLASNIKSSSDNDGLWTAMYLGAEAYRYAVTKSPDAREKARRSFRLLMRLEEITGIPGFPARSFLSKEEPRPGGGEWHPTPDGQWLWKGDTSSDEIVGHYFGYALYYDLAATSEEKREIGQVVARITDHLIRNDYDLIDLDGKPTRWGQWSERYFQTEEGKYESALRSLELLSFLKTAFHITGQKKYQEAYLDRIQRGYAEQMRLYRRWPGGGEINFSDDELAYLSYQPLLKYEKDSKLRRIYLDGLRFTWSQIRSDMNPLWNYISAASGAGRMTRQIREESRRTLERIPLDLIEWAVRNSHRLDIKLRAEKDRFDRLQLAEVLAPDERPVSKWNGNPYRPDGGGEGHSEEDGAFFLLPYWMGRYHGWAR
ncbi:MAG: hypothetical protein HY674_11020 [Chloroflexi bacterium]|nr:hypothetical protein [Chloroflexota bacterium]